MLKQWQTRASILAVLVGATGMLMGGCPQDIFNPGSQPSVAKPAAPSLTFTQPTGRVSVQAGSTISVAWMDTHPAGAVSILLFYDIDGVAGNEDWQPIRTVTESAATFEGTHAWDTTGVDPGVYRLGATLNDQVNDPVTVYLPYEIVISRKADVVTHPALHLLQPATAASVAPGDSIVIRWDAVDFAPEARLFLYYDLDRNYTNDNQSLIAAISPGTGQIGSKEHAWNIPDTIAGGTYHILGRLVNGDGQVLYSYAPGPLTIGGGAVEGAERQLQNIGVTFPGVVFDGYAPNGRLGEVLAGGADFNGDGYDDFLLVAPQLDSNNARPGRAAGEAYLIYSRAEVGRWPQGGKGISTQLVGGLNDSVEGIKFIGPRFLTSSAGIQEVLFIDNVDVGGPEIVFGCPDVNGIAHDQQDYDPEDNDDLHDQSPTPGRYNFQTAGWQEYSTQQDGTRDDWLTWPPVAPGPMRAGMIIYVSGQSQGGARNQIVFLDQVGQRDVDVLSVGMRGMRIYPVAGNDNSYWGAQLATCDLRGVLTPALLVARPQDDGGRGSVKVMLQDLMTSVFWTWTSATPTIPGFTTQPKTYTFPGADTTGGPDPDRIPRWPSPWDTFMERPDVPSGPANPTHFDIMNGDGTTGADGRMGCPTNLHDFNGDTIEDAAVSAPGAVNETGIAYVVYGSSSDFRGADVGQFSAGLPGGFELRGTQAGEQLGHRMIGPGDMNDDGLNDWILSAPGRDWSERANCGAVILVPGRQQLFGSRTVDQVVAELGGAILYGANSEDRFGTYLAVAGDVDRDSYTDFLVAAPGYDSPLDGSADIGAVYLIYGGPHLVGEIDVRQIGTARLPGKIYLGDAAGAGIGPVAGAGDTDGDLHDDFLIGYPNCAAQGISNSGRVYLIYGARRQAP